MRNKVFLIEDLIEKIETLKQEGKKISTTNGSFDLLHVGHIYMLESAKRLTDVLIVLVNSDDSIRSYKGPSRPIVSQNERLEMLSALECVDFVCVFDDDTPLEFIAKIKPHSHFKGGSFEPERIKVEKDLIESWGGVHITLPLVEGKSTTNLVNKILDSYKKND